MTRVKDTLPQARTTSRSQRRTNVDGSFQAAGDLAGLKALLIDDVVTTGATMSSCAEALKRGGSGVCVGVGPGAVGLGAISKLSPFDKLRVNGGWGRV